MKTPMIENNWHHPSKHHDATTEGVCPYCHKHVKALEAHIHDTHLGEKLPSK